MRFYFDEYSLMLVVEHMTFLTAGFNITWFHPRYHLSLSSLAVYLQFLSLRCFQFSSLGRLSSLTFDPILEQSQYLTSSAIIHGDACVQRIQSGKLAVAFVVVYPNVTSWEVWRKGERISCGRYSRPATKNCKALGRDAGHFHPQYGTS